MYIGHIPSSPTVPAIKNHWLLTHTLKETECSQKETVHEIYDRIILRKLLDFFAI